MLVLFLQCLFMGKDSRRQSVMHCKLLVNINTADT